MCFRIFFQEIVSIENNLQRIALEESDFEMDETPNESDSVEISVYCESGQPEKPLPHNQRWDAESHKLIQVLRLCETQLTRMWLCISPSHEEIAIIVMARQK